MSIPIRPTVFDPLTREPERITVRRANKYGRQLVMIGDRELGWVWPGDSRQHGKAPWTAHSVLALDEVDGLRNVEGFRGQHEAIIYLIRVLRGAYITKGE
jgi:hypothetical protein